MREAAPGYSECDRPGEVTVEDQPPACGDLGGDEVAEVFVRRTESLAHRGPEVRAVLFGDQGEGREEGREANVYG